MFIKLRKKKNLPDEKRIIETVKEELAGYVKIEDLKKYLNDVQSDDRKKRIWDSLSSRKKIKLLRYLVQRKGDESGKNKEKGK